MLAMMRGFRRHDAEGEELDGHAALPWLTGGWRHRALGEMGEWEGCRGLPRTLGFHTAPQGPWGLNRWKAVVWNPEEEKNQSHGLHAYMVMPKDDGSVPAREDIAKNQHGNVLSMEVPGTLDTLPSSQGALLVCSQRIWTPLASVQNMDSHNSLLTSSGPLQVSSRP